MFCYILNFFLEQKYKVIFGNFNIIPTASDFHALIQCNYSSIITENTDISLKTPQGTACVDNIWLSTEAKALSTGKKVLPVMSRTYFLVV